MKIVWKGKKNREKAYWKYKPIIEIDNKYFRPTEVNSLKGDFSLAKKELGWMPKIHIKTLIQEMVNDELKFLTDDK
jgi:GDPmannose 4,6-dehydratase